MKKFHVKQKHQRLILISSGLVGLGIAVFLTLMAFQESLVFYYAPSDLLNKNVSSQERIRVGGLVEVQSLKVKKRKVRRPWIQSALALRREGGRRRAKTAPIPDKISTKKRRDPS
jgi:hypothetical protein